MATDDRAVKPQQSKYSGVIDEVSMFSFSPDQRVIDAALNSVPLPQQQGGVCDKFKNMPAGASQPGSDRGSLPRGFKP